MRTIFIGFPWREFVADFIGAFAVFVFTPILRFIAVYIKRLPDRWPKSPFGLERRLKQNFRFSSMPIPV